MDRKTIAVVLVLLYIVYKARQFAEWVRTERRKYRKRERVRSASTTRELLIELCGCANKKDRWGMPAHTSHKVCGQRYPVTYSPTNLYTGHQDYGAYYAVVVFTELFVVAALVSYVYTSF